MSIIAIIYLIPEDIGDYTKVGESVNLLDTITLEITGDNSDFKNKHNEVTSLSLIVLDGSSLLSSSFFV